MPGFFPRALRRTALLVGLPMLLLASASPALAERCTLAFRNVNVIPMDRERVLRGRTVRLAGDRILSIGRSAARARGCDRIVDGRGRYLLPGLIDMHVHVESDIFAEGLGLPPPELRFEDLLFPYLAYGVTGIRILSGAPDILAFRRSGAPFAPRMLVSSPMLSGEPPILPEPITRVVRTPAEALDAVNGFADSGYDLIKVRENLASLLPGIVAAARARNLEVDGHAARSPDPFAFGQRGFAHVDELALLVEAGRFTPEEIARRMLACSCYATTTLSVEHGAAAQLRDFDSAFGRPEVRFVHPLLKSALWVRERNPYVQERQDPAFFDALLQTDFRIVRALAAAGVPLMAGTDAMIPMIVPGFSLHEELALLVEAGLTPFHAISAATRTPAQIYPAFADLGILAPGRTANMILVASNPLADLSVLRRPEMTIIGGRVLSRAEMDRRMEAIARGYATGG